MAEEIYHPHDLMVRTVLSDLTEAASFLQTHLPETVSQALNWSTLKLLEGSFVDEDLRESEADLLYERSSTSQARPCFGSMCSWSISQRQIAGCGCGC